MPHRQVKARTYEVVPGLQPTREMRANGTPLEIANRLHTALQRKVEADISSTPRAGAQPG